MEQCVRPVTAPSGRYDIDGRRLGAESTGFAEAVAAAYAARRRPRCLCVAAGVEVYIARLGDGWIVKRMPDTGSRHAPACPSYEPPPETSGLDQVLGSAISEDPATGNTTLKLDFALTKIPGRSSLPPSGSECESVETNGARLSLRGLLHYLWDQAELTRWHPGFAGKRTWATVRRHLLQAAEHKLAGGGTLRTRLYVPEPFFVEDRGTIDARRLAQWQHGIPNPGHPHQLMLVVGEVKEIVPARYGFKAVIKHVPNQAFGLDEQLFRRLGRRFGDELALWASASDLHMVVIATFGVSTAGTPTIIEMSLMPVTSQWLPIEDAFERQVVERLVTSGRTFVKGLRYNLRRSQWLATATLIDTGDTVAPLFIMKPGLGSADWIDESCGPLQSASPPAWIWHPEAGPMPALPKRLHRLPAQDVVNV